MVIKIVLGSKWNKSKVYSSYKVTLFPCIFLIFETHFSGHGVFVQQGFNFISFTFFFTGMDPIILLIDYSQIRLIYMT